MAPRRLSPSISELADVFDLLRRRATLQKRSIEDSAEAWQRWSSTIDEAMEIADTLSVSPARSIADLSIKFATLLKVLEFNRSVVDKDDLRSLRRFGRDLAR